MQPFSKEQIEKAPRLVLTRKEQDFLYLYYMSGYSLSKIGTIYNKSGESIRLAVKNAVENKLKVDSCKKSNKRQVLDAVKKWMESQDVDYDWERKSPPNTNAEKPIYSSLSALEIDEP
jgi:predicted DNA-binding protein YlxM (UPF0122 family)